MTVSQQALTAIHGTGTSTSGVGRLHELLLGSEIVRLMGAHSPLSAKIVQEVGFDGIWVSGLEVSTLAGVPDANILSMNQSLQAAFDIATAVDLPVLADCDSGFGNINNVIDMVRRYERAGIAGVCIEDKQYPKLNSFVKGNQDLAPIEDFTTKLLAATHCRNSPDFVVVARIEALISGAGQGEALRRAEAYEAAGADALLIHSKKSTPDEIYEFRKNYMGGLPLIVVPTTYHSVTAAELQDHGFSAIIYANYALRGSIVAMQDILARIHRDGTTRNIESSIVPLQRVFELQGMNQMLEEQAHFEKLALGVGILSA